MNIKSMVPLAMVAMVFGVSRAGAESPAPPTSDAQLTASLDRRIVLRAALERNFAVRVSEQRARAMRAAAKAEGGLPPPELMGQVWQVPFSNPTALNSQMIMVGLTQNFPAPGVLSAREQSMAAQANQEEAMGGDRARMILREAGHAYSDYQESSAKHRIHRGHLQITRHLLDVAEARHATGGSLMDVTRTQVELSRVEADVVTDATLLESARSHLNALLARDADAPLGPPVETEPMVSSWDVPTLLAKARASRPEFKQALAEREAREYAVKAAEREATWPSFSVGALYFPPTTAMPQHSYGASLSMSLPWLWGAAGDRKDAEREFARAASTNVQAARIPVDAEVVTAESKARSAAYRLQVLRDRTLPTSRRSFDAAQAGFESGRTDLMTVLDASRMVVDVEHEIVMAGSDLAHALTDLEAAVGAEVPLRPLGSFDPKRLDGGGDVH
jgi:cobalt-zinc-cadmium efflux system outer membrane protein